MDKQPEQQKVFTTFNAPDGALMILLTPKDLGFSEPPPAEEIFDERFLRRWSDQNFERHLLELNSSKSPDNGHGLSPVNVERMLGKDFFRKFLLDKEAWYRKIWITISPFNDQIIGSYVTCSGTGYGQILNQPKWGDENVKAKDGIIFRLRERNSWVQFSQVQQ